MKISKLVGILIDATENVKIVWSSGESGFRADIGETVVQISEEKDGNFKFLIYCGNCSGTPEEYNTSKINSSSSEYDADARDFLYRLYKVIRQYVPLNKTQTTLMTELSKVFYPAG
ncbi:MAG: hypothetical protein WC608_01560 [Parcubacteria group bacterium]